MNKNLREPTRMSPKLFIQVASAYTFYGRYSDELSGSLRGSTPVRKPPAKDCALMFSISGQHPQFQLTAIHLCASTALELSHRNSGNAVF